MLRRDQDLKAACCTVAHSCGNGTLEGKTVVIFADKSVRDGTTSEARALPRFGKWATAIEPGLQGWKQALSCHHEGSMQSHCSLYRG